MDYNKLGKVDLNISKVALGCWAFAGGLTWGSQEEQDSLDTIDAAIANGINFFDTAEAYGAGESEEILGKGLKGRRNDAVIATKVILGENYPDRVIKACEESLKRLQTDYIDLYQIHWPPAVDVPIADYLAEMNKLVEQGKVRYIGVCNFGVNGLKEASSVSEIVTNQVPYNLFWRAIEYEILPYSAEQSIGVLPYSPLGQGLLTGKFKSADEVPAGRARTRLFSPERENTKHQEEGCEEEMFAALPKIEAVCEQVGEPMSRIALAWLLHQKGVTSVLAGARNVGQVEENVEAANIQLSADVLQELDKVTQPIKEKIGSNADMWRTESRFI